MNDVRIAAIVRGRRTLPAVLMLAVIAALVLSGCASGGPTSPAPAVPSQAVATDGPATQAPASTEAPAATQPPATEAPATGAPATEAPATAPPAPTEARAATEAPPATEAPAATSAPAATGSISYANDVMPVFEQTCVKCHGGDKTEADLSLKTFDVMMQGGQHGAVVVAGDPNNSLLVKQIQNGKMPKRAPKLPPSTIDMIAQWVKEGAQNN